MKKQLIVKYILIALAGLLTTIVFLLVPEGIEVLKSFFTIKEKVFVVIFVLLIFLFPMIFRICNGLIRLKNNKLLHEKNKNICPIIGEEHCCIDDYANKLTTSGQGVLEINKNKFLSDYNLTLVNVMNDEERAFGENTKNNEQREVWIFSYNLGTEVLGDFSQSVAAKNVENNIRYVYFHTNNTLEKDSININKQKIISGVSNDKQNLISFIPLEEDNTDGIDILAHIIGSIIFVLPEESGLKKSYFSLRGNADKPIYFRLPRCMNENYYKYFAKRKNQYEDKQNKNCQCDTKQSASC